MTYEPQPSPLQPLKLLVGGIATLIFFYGSYMALFAILGALTWN